MGIRAHRGDGDIALAKKRSTCARKPDDEILVRWVPRLCKKPGGCSRPGPDDDLEFLALNLPSLSRAA